MCCSRAASAIRGLPQQRRWQRTRAPASLIDRAVPPTPGQHAPLQRRCLHGDRLDRAQRRFERRSVRRNSASRVTLHRGLSVEVRAPSRSRTSVPSASWSCRSIGCRPRTMTTSAITCVRRSGGTTCDLRAHLARKRSRVKTSAYHRALGGDVCNSSSPPKIGRE